MTLDSCGACGLDPNQPEHEGRQVYVCDFCGALVCAECSEDAPGNGVSCLPCQVRQ